MTHDDMPDALAYAHRAEYMRHERQDGIRRKILAFIIAVTHVLAALSALASVLFLAWSIHASTEMTGRLPADDVAAWTAARSENCAMRASDLAYAVDPRFWSRERSREAYRECMNQEVGKSN